MDGGISPDGLKKIKTDKTDLKTIKFQQYFFKTQSFMTENALISSGLSKSNQRPV